MQLLTPSFGLIIWTLIAFLTVFFILKKFAWPAIISGLKEREDSITRSLEMAEKVKNEMLQLQGDNEALLRKTQEERAIMLKEARDTKDKIVNEAKEQAKKETAKIVAEAQVTIEVQKMAALTDVKNQIGKLVIEVSEKVLRKELANKEAQEVHIQDLVKDLKLN